ncbi:MAG: GNAT family N-acetyltransferase [Chloroflexota bacterium]|nr:GNAT family N-acetyltransferase [Chloroflexota bacterium]
MTDTSLANFAPRELPTTAPLEGARIIVRPTDVADDAAGLYAATRDGDPALWDYLPYGPFTDETDFEQWLARHVADPTMLTETVVDGRSGQPVGSASYMRMDPEFGVVEIGHIFFGAALQRTPAATEALSLMMRHVFDDLGYRRLEWKCNAANVRSRRAAERLGFTYEGTFRQHLIVKGRNRDTAWFSTIDKEWPPIRSAFEAWLAPDNFDANGQQIRRLAELRGAG